MDWGLKRRQITAAGHAGTITAARLEAALPPARATSRADLSHHNYRNLQRWPLFPVRWLAIIHPFTLFEILGMFWSEA